MNPRSRHTTFQLGGTVGRGDARRLRQLAHPDKILRIQTTDATDEIVADPRPIETRGLVADVMRHGRGARRKDRQVGTALALEPELRLLQALADLIVTHFRQWRRHVSRDLRLAELLQLSGCRGVVPVTVDDHPSVFSRRSSVRIRRQHLLHARVRLALLADRGEELAILQLDAVHRDIHLRDVDRVVLAVEQIVVARDVRAVVADVAEERAERTVVVERQRQRADRARGRLHAECSCPWRS